jgi:hypothetical protein
MACQLDDDRADEASATGPGHRHPVPAAARADTATAPIAQGAPKPTDATASAPSQRHRNPGLAPAVAGLSPTTSVGSVPDHPNHPNHPNHPEAPLTSGGPWQLLRDAGASLHPAVVDLQARLAAADGSAWLATEVGKGPRDGTLLSGLVADALRAAAALAGGNAAIDSALDIEVLAQIWDLVAQHAPAPAADIAGAALLAVEQRRTPARPMAAPTAPRRVGKYVLLRPIGIGASGSVHEGRHCDNGLLAAVKLLRLDACDPVHVERFREEARIIARLEHPSIVRVLDSGVEEIGGFAVPYLVSELVRGRRFTLATAGWDVPAVLRAFAAVCDAVAHAHERGILHRDLKSSNVLVDDAGLPHLLDFGIARMIEDRTVEATRTGLLLGTPTAMSPEQAAGAPVDARSEVWSLGALLFESLSGVPPHDLAGLAGVATLRRIAEDAPRRLDELRPELPRDVLAVVHKALATDRRDRYGTVQLLLDDVHRLAAGDPVAARPPTAWRLLGHLARRHRLLTASAAAVLATAVGGGAAVTNSWLQAEQARVESVAAMERTLGFAGRLVEMMTPSAELRRLLEDSLAPLAELDLGSAPEARLRVAARLREHLGDLECRGGNGDAARDQRQRALLLEQALRARGVDNRGDLARALVKLADLDRPVDPDRAQAAYIAAHALLAADAAAPDAAFHQLDDLGWSHERLAQAAIQRQDWRAADSHLTERIALARRLLARQPDGVRHFGLACGLITQVHVINGRAHAANTDARIPALLREACEHLRTAVATEPGRVTFLGVAVVAHLTWAEIQFAHGQPAEALATVEHLQPWLRSLLATAPDNEPHGLIELRRLWLTVDCRTRIGDHRAAAEQGRALLAALPQPVVQTAWLAQPPAWRAMAERTVWLAGWRAADAPLLAEAGARLRAALEHLPRDAASVEALATFAQWSASADRLQAEQVLATAQEWGRRLPADDPATVAAQAAVATAAQTIAPSIEQRRR